MAHTLKLARLILYPFLIVSFFIFLFLNLFPTSRLTFVGALTFGIVFSTIIIYKDRLAGKIQLSLKDLAPFVAASFIFTLAIGWVTSPSVVTKSVSNHQFLSVNSIGDYHKHLFVTTAISKTGLPPIHPYFQPAKLSYYYGYYLIPSAISSAFNLEVSAVFYVYLLITIFVGLLVSSLLLLSVTKSTKYAFIAFILLIFGTGLDLIPTMIETKRGLFSTMHHIELWSYLHKVRYVVSNIYICLLWVPQHFFAALISVIMATSILAGNKLSKVWVFLVIWFVLLSSIFVALTLALWMVIILISKKTNRLSIIVPGVVAVLLLSPFLSSIRDRGNLLSFGFYMQPYNYLPNLPKVLNIALEIITEYGFLIFALPLYFFTEKNKRLRWLITFGVGSPIVAAMFIQSSGYAGVNDFAMRIVIPSQIALVILLIKGLEKLSNPLRSIVLFLAGLNLIFSIGGCSYEMYWRWKERKLLDLPTSELILNLRKKPIENILVLKSEEWSYLIPSYASLPITGPGLFDAAVYVSGEDGLSHGEFEGLVNRTFNDPTVTTSPEETIYVRNENFNNLLTIFQLLPGKILISPTHRWVKGGLDPWTAIFTRLAPGIPISSEYLQFETNSLTLPIINLEIFVSTQKLSKIELKGERRFSLPQGFWFIIACDNVSQIKFELEDYYTLFDVRSTEGSQSCAGDIYYQPKDENVLISSRSRFKDLYIVPVEMSIEKR